jgi:hypothetical protein
MVLPVLAVAVAVVVDRGPLVPPAFLEHPADLDHLEVPLVREDPRQLDQAQRQPRELELLLTPDLVLLQLVKRLLQLVREKSRLTHRLRHIRLIQRS